MNAENNQFIQDVCEMFDNGKITASEFAELLLSIQILPGKHFASKQKVA